jgi:hypothetical protein
MERKIVKYRVDVELLGYEVIKLHLSDSHLRYLISNQPSARENPFWSGSKNLICITRPDGSIFHLKVEGKNGSKLGKGRTAVTYAVRFLWYNICYLPSIHV